MVVTIKVPTLVYILRRIIKIYTDLIV